MQLQNKIALVTGSATGIGEAIARRFAGEGAKVMIHGREVEREAGERIATELNGAFYAAQLENPDECAALIENTVAHFGGLDILVNNAATIPRSNLHTTDTELFDYTIAVNVRAPFLLVKHAFAHKENNLRVLNIGSVNAYCGEANLMAYSVSKGALMTLTRNLADAHGAEGLRVNQINPGWVLTPNEYQTKIKDGLPENWPDIMPRSMVPGGRLLKPEEIAHFALMFMADDAALINGAVVELEQHPFIGRNPTKESV